MSKSFIIKPHLEKKNKSFRQVDIPRFFDLFHQLLGSLYFLFNYDVILFSRLVNILMQQEVLKIVADSKPALKDVCSHVRLFVDQMISSYKLYLIYCRLVEDYLELNDLLDKPDSISNLKVKHFVTFDLPPLKHNPLTNPVPMELELKTLEYFKLQMNIFIDKGISTIDMFGLSRELQQFVDKGTRNYPFHEDTKQKEKLDTISRSFKVLSSKENKIITKRVMLMDEKTKDASSIHADLKASLKSLKSLTKYLSLKVYTANFTQLQSHYFIMLNLDLAILSSGNQYIVFFENESRTILYENLLISIERIIELYSINNVFFIEKPQRTALQAIKDQIISIILGDPLEYMEIPPQLISNVKNLIDTNAELQKNKSFTSVKKDHGDLTLSQACTIATSMQQSLVDMACNPNLISSLHKVIDSSPIDRKLAFIHIILEDLVRQKGIRPSNEFIVADPGLKATLDDTTKELLANSLVGLRSLKEFLKTRFTTKK